MPSTLALLAHPARVDSLVDWLLHNPQVLYHFDLLTTPELIATLEQRWGNTKPRWAKLPSIEAGGDIVLAHQILAGEVAGVFFLADPQVMATVSPNFPLVLRACQIHDIPIACTEASARLMLRGLAQGSVAYMIFNPVAGQGNPNIDLATIREILEPQILVNVIMTQPNVDPADQAREIIATIQSKQENDIGQSLIIASGGDGTVSAVAGATIGTGIPLGIIPRGTANAFSVGLGIPTNLRAACATILAGNTHVVDAARCNDTPMILLAGLGFEAGMVDKASRELKNELGNLAYLLAGVKQLATAQPFTATVEFEDQVTQFTTTAITIANVAPATSVLAQGLGRVIPDDGLLEVTIATGQTRFQNLSALVSLAASATRGNPNQREDILGFRTPKLKITTDPPQKLVIDGEMVEANPVEFECIPDGLTIFAPLPTV
ncbi:YegS/Rv2252/BmrU family lipid kinase [Phormidium sp. FACHB-1136]|uniref:YegS/Rv2252/BmrU family lipid kinase n=1 Tax=Phormidium sp. FACHB-1136 TaxID=2692848 RepID=UPI0016879261|nr:YegS/Rv2252/BmrU family lipid kinase [Phormidium sp. FACHB-1136]MBD2426997.1 YegS/Rv2252/BmrU family lipid kinase [Phormidium sp. FACHB-1136]